MDEQSVNLDVLRATAVILVVVSHLSQVLARMGFGTRLWAVAGLGYFGVFLFFIHTSLVLMMSLERLHKSGSAVTARFYVRRAFRIYPLSMLTVFVVLALRIPAYLDRPFVAFSAPAMWANLLLVQNIFRQPEAIGPFWSLPYEVQMYLILPFLYMPARRIRSLRDACLLIAAGFTGRYLEGQLASAAGYHAVLTYAPWFCMGVAAYGLWRHAAPRLSPKIFAGFLAIYALSPWIAGKAGFRDSALWSQGYITWAMGIGIAMTLPYFFAFRWRFLCRTSHLIAKYSYGIYLAHVPILWLAFYQLAGKSRVLQVATFGGLLLVVPVLLFHLVEDPFIRFGSRLAQRLARR